MSPAKGEKLIEVKGLEKHFKHVEVLRGINIDICKGDVVAVIGPSGSGKSTFLRCLNLLEEPTGGQIVFEGVDITSKETKIDQMRQKIGMVFQQFNLFTNMTVLDNVSAGPVLVKGMKRDEAHKLAQSLLERVGLGDRGAGRYPAACPGGHDHGGRHPRDGLCPRGGEPRGVHRRGRYHGGGRSGGVLRQPQKPAFEGFSR